MVSGDGTPEQKHADDKVEPGATRCVKDDDDDCASSLKAASGVLPEDTGTGDSGPRASRNVDIAQRNAPRDASSPIHVKTCLVTVETDDKEGIVTWRFYFTLEEAPRDKHAIIQVVTDPFRNLGLTRDSTTFHGRNADGSHTVLEEYQLRDSNVSIMWRFPFDSHTVSIGFHANSKTYAWSMPPVFQSGDSESWELRNKSLAQYTSEQYIPTEFVVELRRVFPAGLYLLLFVVFLVELSAISILLIPPKTGLALRASLGIGSLTGTGASAIAAHANGPKTKGLTLLTVYAMTPFVMQLLVLIAVVVVQGHDRRRKKLGRKLPRHTLNMRFTLTIMVIWTLLHVCIVFKIANRAIFEFFRVFAATFCPGRILTHIAADAESCIEDAGTFSAGVP